MCTVHFVTVRTLETAAADARDILLPESSELVWPPDVYALLGHTTPNAGSAALDIAKLPAPSVVTAALADPSA